MIKCFEIEQIRCIIQQKSDSRKFIAIKNILLPLLATLIIEFFLMHRIQIDTELYKDIYADWLTLEMGRNKINKKQIVTTTFHLPFLQCYIRSENADSSLARVAFWLVDSYFRLFLFFILAFFLGWKIPGRKYNNNKGRIQNQQAEGEG